MKRFQIISGILVLLVSGAAIFNFVSAQEEPPPEECVPGPIETSVSVSGSFRCNDFVVYECANNFCGKSGGAMEQGIEWYMCETTDESWTDGCESGSSSFTYQVSGPHGPDQIQPYGGVPDYQTCPSNYNSWSTAVPIPACSGTCYPAPDLKSLSDPDLLPKNVSEASQYKLPVNFSWEDNVKTEVAAPPNFCAVNSYEFNVAEPPISLTVPDTQLQKIEDPAYKLECQLESAKNYQWKVRACLDAGGSDCGEWSKTQSFNTSPAPELVSPYDSDWMGVMGAGNSPLPVTLNWCDVNEANSFLLRVYIMQGGNKVCHPNLLSTKDGKEFCDSETLRKKRRDPEQLERILYSDFTDENLSFFTQDSSYFWEVATCLDDSGLNCQGFSQQWTFDTQQKEFPKTFLVGPPDDPSGQKPVGLPLVLDWRKDAGINSWWYKINSKQEFTKTSQSRSFDYPELTLNTFYQWQALSCFDYEGKQCQSSWSDVYIFKTTGQPPGLTYPAADTANISIPVNFGWQDVPGAKSYIISVRGDGLNVEKTIAESNFIIDFPEFPIRQEADYTWQVKTCARENGQTCGAYSNSQSFRTFRISPPQNPAYPQNKGTLFTDEHFLSWEKITRAKAYQYEIKLLSASAEEKSQECSVPPLQTALANSGYVELGCLGQYQWQVRSCLDENCRETSNWSGFWTFTFLEGGGGQGGLVPCGRATNNPETPWNEREPCQVKHLFLSIKVILDFMLLRLIPIILVLLTVATGVIFYTSFGGASVMAQTISLWKAAGVGLGLILFAWLIINLFLGLVGYNVGVFGNWHSL